ncbi:unnamed protein product [Musa hybrid cultivar]
MWAVVGICVGAAFVLLLFLLSLWIAHNRSTEPSPVPAKQAEEESPVMLQRIHVETGKEHRITYPERRSGGGGGSSHGSGESRSADQAPASVPEVSHLGWGHWYTMRELEVATGMFFDENAVEEGGYGIVYHGVLEDDTQIAVKNLLNNRGQAERRNSRLKWKQ